MLASRVAPSRLLKARRVGFSNAARRASAVFRLTGNLITTPAGVAIGAAWTPRVASPSRRRASGPTRPTMGNVMADESWCLAIALWESTEVNFDDSHENLIRGGLIVASDKIFDLFETAAHAQLAAKASDVNSVSEHCAKLVAEVMPCASLLRWYRSECARAAAKLKTPGSKLLSRFESLHIFLIDELAGIRNGILAMSYPAEFRAAIEEGREPTYENAPAWEKAIPFLVSIVISDVKAHKGDVRRELYEAIELIPIEPGPTTVPPRADRRSGTVAERMKLKMCDDDSCIGWSAEAWATYLGCAPSTIKESDAWGTLMRMREFEKGNSAIARRGQSLAVGRRPK